MASRVVAEYQSTSQKSLSPHRVSIDDDGNVWCDCWPWKRSKTCPHVADYELSLTEDAEEEPDIMGPTGSIGMLLNKIDALEKELAAYDSLKKRHDALAALTESVLDLLESNGRFALDDADRVDEIIKRTRKALGKEVLNSLFWALERV